MRGELKAIGAVTQGLNNAKGIGKVAIAGATGISDLLQTVRQKLTELSNEGITTAKRGILADHFNQLMSPAAKFIDKERKSVVWGRRVAVRVNLGGRRIIKKNIEN